MFMKTKAIVKMKLVIPLVLICSLCRAQQLDIDVREIESLIKEWNFANNSQSLESFRNVYAQSLVFYTQRWSRERVITFKKKLFSSNPKYAQKITGEIKQTPYTGGVIKCEFQKNVLEKFGWTSYPSYLLLSYEEGRYWIVGESDEVTDKRLKYKPDIGEPMLLESTSSDSTALDSNGASSQADSATTPADTADHEMQSAGVRKSLGNLASIYSYVSSQETVTIRRDWIFILIGILLFGGMLIFLAASKSQQGVGKSRKSKGRDLEKSTVEQSQFEAFVVTLFDPLYFSYSRLKASENTRSDIAVREVSPELHFHFHHKEKEHAFAVQCLYVSDVDESDVVIKLFPQEQLQQYRNYQDRHGIDVYYVVGIGGTPDDPREMYLLPAAAVEREVVSRDALRNFNKSGMFFYNDSVGRLQ
jgi:hypothetical protein